MPYRRAPLRAVTVERQHFMTAQSFASSVFVNIRSS